jgi:hypothetical protein
MGLKEQIFARSLKRIPHEVKEWECTVYIRRISGAEREQCVEASQQARESGKENGMAFQYKLLSISICDESGAPLFTEDEIKNKLDSDVMDGLFDATSKLNGFGKSEELEKNSGTAPSGGSGSN